MAEAGGLAGGAGEARERPLACLLVAGGKYHDFDFARLELLKLLARHPRVRTRVVEDYECPAAIAAADLILSYTCDVIPSPAAAEALAARVAAGARWLALHGTNSLLRFDGAGRASTPDEAPAFMELLGSQFAAHPPIGPLVVEPADPQHPLVAGLAPFETVDETYLVEMRAPVHVLLDTHFPGGRVPGFAVREWPAGRQPVVYLRAWGRGAVLYNTLGHCRGHHDLRPLADWWPSVDRCSWERPEYHELLRRGLAWAIAGADAMAITTD
jgi:type 1 glutamine amidotransferase